MQMMTSGLEDIFRYTVSLVLRIVWRYFPIGVYWHILVQETFFRDIRGTYQRVKSRIIRFLLLEKSKEIVYLGKPSSLPIIKIIVLQYS
jgi:hypothetical protein